ncbi:amidohydrolase [Pseudooceanicola nanhaiensis]|jgi:hippurate hydrolase|uniref:Amidohydrolase n=1 Tax=Pseudooceanicola nanhaiensis TaxID=375761 RepID=A0A917WCL6_9RHOB|nr:M20 aminoacylase family protein [Pseudooceanicola nanhaiensis]GGL90046.1 amidohydrolase [Pseudooceanicola nanhaiensis]
MPVINRIAGFADEMKAWRRHLHAHPELGFDCHETAAYVVERLKEFGVDEIHEGIAKTGVVAIINGRGAGPTIGLRADMDALPIVEATGAKHASKIPGKMHACGHDGHTAMLLGAAKYLAETRNFSGRVALIFQPAEELGGGAGVMVREGALDRFDVAQVYAVHNAPGMPLGTFMTGPGPVLASDDTFHIRIKGQGGHAANPQETRDPIMAAVAIAQALQTIVSRNHYAREEIVLSVTQIHAGSADNVIPETAYINGTVRSFLPEVREMAERRMKEIVKGQALAFGVKAKLDYDHGYPPTVNDPEKSLFAAEAARAVVPADQVVHEENREMGAEDFAYMLEARPGAYMVIGQGEGDGLHQPGYDFNDEIAPLGASYFVRLVESAQPVD